MSQFLMASMAYQSQVLASIATRLGAEAGTPPEHPGIVFIDDMVDYMHHEDAAIQRIKQQAKRRK